MRKMAGNLRYQRQELIKGWDQGKLEAATVSIVGCGYMGQYAAIPLAALGVGNIRLIDDSISNGEMFLDFELEKRIPRAHSLEEKLKIVNPDLNVIGISSRVLGDAAKYLLRGSSFIVEATNNPTSKAVVMEYCHETGTPFISCSGMPYYGKALMHNRRGIDVRYLLPEFKGGEQDEFVSMIFGGLIAEEVKKVIMKNDGILQVPLYYNFTSSNSNGNRERFSRRDDIGSENGGTGGESHKELADLYGKLSALIVGAGALGNFVALGLAKLGFGRADVIDHDTVEQTNLNRQVLYYDQVDKEKAKALAAKIRKISSGKVKADGIVEKFTEKSEFERKYDLLLDCVDNFTVRAIINDYALAHGIPLISGATDFQAGQAANYVPGKTACMDCQLNIHEEGRKAQQARRRAGCLEAPNPSVIMTNQIIAGIMVNEARTAFHPELHGEPINGILKYGSTLEARLGINWITKTCSCKPKGGLSAEDFDEEDRGADEKNVEGKVSDGKKKSKRKDDEKEKSGGYGSKNSGGKDV